MIDPNWTLSYDTWVPNEQPLREVLCALGNGRFCTRGAFEEMSAGDGHYPGTYLAAGYNRAISEIHGREIENEDLVNWPNWLPLTFRAAGGSWLDLGEMDASNFRQTLDMQCGRLLRHVDVRDLQGRRTRLRSERVVSMAEPHLAAISWALTPLDWSGEIEIQSLLDGTARNTGVARYTDLESRHFDVESVGDVPGQPHAVALVAVSCQSRRRVAMSARTRLFADFDIADANRHSRRDLVATECRVGHALAIRIQRGETLRVEKIVSVRSCRDMGISEPFAAACLDATRAGDFESIRNRHESAWHRLWRQCDVQLETTDDADAQRVLRLHLFHLLQTVSPNTIGIDTGVPARGWHGEAYRGHIFWDELFILPFLHLRVPELSRWLLMYRFRRLPEARRLAHDDGCRGAVFPWQSGSSGREESQVLHLNPKSGRWIPDDTHLQRHINSAVAYSVWNYFQATGDTDFLRAYGAELLVEIARYWADKAAFDATRDRYEIRGVVGPDEYHTRYPHSESPGLNNNAYTNVMAVWSLLTAREALHRIDDEHATALRDMLRISDGELDRWDDVARRMFVPFHRDDPAIIAQFEGFEDLPELDWDDLRKRHGDVQRLDRVLEAENDSPNNYQVCKQADVLMLFYLFRAEELQDLFDHMGYAFEPATAIPANIAYYRQRTSHGSTLSRQVFSWVLARSDRPGSWPMFREALRADISDVQGGTTPEGIHLGAMAGTVDFVQRCWTGLEFRNDALVIEPRLPDTLRALTLRIRHFGRWFELLIADKTLTVKVEGGGTKTAFVVILGRPFTLEPGQEIAVPLKRR